MIKSLVLATALSSAPLAAQTSPASEAPLALELQTALHCSAMFAIVAADQSRGAKWALAYPPLQVRGKEYFVRVGAQSSSW